MNRSPFAFVGITALLLSQACTSSVAPPDPTSYWALHKAAPMRWGTTCVKSVISSYGSSFDTTRTDVCMQDSDCSELPDENDADYVGGEAFTSRTIYSVATYFEGTCADPHVVSCEARTAEDSCQSCQHRICCASVALCEDDPNCIAVSDCLTNCKDDESCAQRCVTHGDPSAVNHLRAALECTRSACSDVCQ